MKNGIKPLHNRRALILGTGAAATAALLGSALPFLARAADASSARRRIGIVGSGRVGGTLGRIWLQAGHEVMFSSRNLEQNRKMVEGLGPNARAGTAREAAAFGEVLLVAVPYTAMKQVGQELGELLKGKVVIDASNPIVARDGEVATWAREKGAGLASAELLPGARIVRAFNAIGYARMAEAGKRTERIGMPMAGEDAEAISLASALVRDIGFEPVLVGPLAMGRYLMPGTPLAGENTPDAIRKIAAALH